MGTSDRKPYESATVLDQDLLDACHDSLTCQLEMVVEIETPSGVIYASDRNKYVGGTFYEARTNFPVIKRTIGEFLDPQLEFSTLELELNNVDGRYNDILPAGDNFGGWIGKEVTVRQGLRDIDSTYKTIFKGQITEEGGVKRSVKSITILARDSFDKINANFPKTIFTETSFPNMESTYLNKILPVIYGDWTVNVEAGAASIPAYPVNGKDPDVNGDSSHTSNVSLYISENDNTFFDSSAVYLKRGDNWWLFNSLDITVGLGNRIFEIAQNGNLITALTPEATDQFYEFASGDAFFVKVKGKTLGAYDDNPLEQARDILLTYGGLIAGDFDTSWNTYRDKASPSVSAIATMKSRVWIQEPVGALQYALSLLEQVRLEAFLNRDLKLKISSLHLEDFIPDPSFTMRNWDIEKDSFQPRLDERNNFNRVKAFYNFLPNVNENALETAIYKNSAAIAQVGKEISKKILFPNLYVENTVIDQVTETLRITTSYLEHVEVNATWRSLLLDIGDFVKLNVNIQSTVFQDVPAIVREIGYDPDGMKIPIRLWSFQMMTFPGWSPSWVGTIVGGSTATITKE